MLAVDEKPHIQALERAQGYLKLKNGRTLTGHSHDYTRHGTTTLFAALNVATGEVRAGHYRRRRRVEFLDFMNKIVADHPDRDIHVVLDNLNTHKPKRDGWLPRHPNVRFHFTPTHASWMNQVETGSQSSAAPPSKAPASPRPNRYGIASMPSSNATIPAPIRSPGPPRPSIRNTSAPVSPIPNSRY